MTAYAIEDTSTYQHHLYYQTSLPSYLLYVRPGSTKQNLLEYTGWTDGRPLRHLRYPTQGQSTEHRSAT